MLRTTRLAPAAVAALLACGAPDRGRGTSIDPGPSHQEPPMPDAYDGPPLRAELVTGPAAEPQVAVAVEAPSGGHELVADGVETVAGRLRARFTLTTPGDDEMTTMALVTLRAWQPVPAAAGPVDVVVKTVQRGVYYFVEPPYRRAATLER